MIIGLTGGIASGKSTVSRMLKKLGAVVVDADKIARAVVAKGSPLLGELAKRFGNAILTADGQLDRRRLGDKVFADASAKAALDHLLHPVIQQEIERQTKAYEKAGEKIIVLDIPLLYETGWDEMTDEVWVVYVDAKTQRNRLMARNGFSRTQAQNRMNSQLPLEEKRRRASFVIDNTHAIAYTKQQVLKKWQKIKEEVR